MLPVLNRGDCSRLRDATASCDLPSASLIHRRSRRLLAISVALLLGTAGPVLSQSLLQPNPSTSTSDLPVQESVEPAGEAQLLLQADKFIYDNDAETVTAFGDVRLDYNGRNVVADRIIYNQRTRRVRAYGNVEIIEPDGNRTYAQEIDITDDFGSGFVNSLRVETADNTRFAAESAERLPGDRTVFNNGVYTACNACKDDPEKPPLWQVKAKTVILDGQAKTITYKHARLEFWGLPIAYFPWFQQPSPDVKRKTGLLIPKVGYREELGFMLSQSLFIATGDTHDLTITTTGYSRQGLLTQADWRHQFDSGRYTLSVAGIDQQDRNAFRSAPDNTEDQRGLIATTGLFDLNSRWQFGWNVMQQTDSRFAKTYDIDGYSGTVIQNNIFLRGLANRSYFDLTGYQFLVQGSNFHAESEEAIVHPVLDYNYRKGLEIGELALDVNLTSLTRAALDADSANNIPFNGDQRTFGTDGDKHRVSAKLGWETVYNTPMGLSLRPSLSVLGDVTSVNSFAAAGSEVVDQDTHARIMPTAALEASYPILARTENSSHVFEPIAQLLLRPDLAYTGILPNDDSQSLVFDTTTLFEHDKFAGYDRIESGVRLNFGIRYSATFTNDLTLSGLFGQSLHLAGDNPYAQADLVNVGIESGLDTDSSDYVAALGATLPRGFSVNTQARFDRSDLTVERAEAAVNYNNGTWGVTGRYVFINEQPIHGFATDREQIGLSAKYTFLENWTAFAAADYDITNNALIRDQVGLSYHDECYTFSLAFTETRSRFTTDEVNQSVSVKFSLRTLGDFSQEVEYTDVQELFGNEEN